MIVKILSIKSKGEFNAKTQESIGEEGPLFFPCDRMTIPLERSGCILATTKIERITVETKNSIYELEPVEDLKEDNENE